jgi:ribosome biogenesis GTPase A
MNTLVKKKVAAVGDEPAVTKSQQRIQLTPRLVLVDTPGMMWPKITHDSDGYMLAVAHAIGRNAVIDEDVATFLAGLLLARYPDTIRSRYKLDPDSLDAPGVLEGVARKRGCILKGRGGELDLEKEAMIFLTDFRDGLLGRISLETPETRRAMLAAAEPPDPAVELV